MTTFTKLSNLVNDQMTILRVGVPTFKKWDTEQNKMLTATKREPGYRKLYPVETDKGLLDMGTGQVGSLLEAVMYNGKCDLIGKTFAVKSNGKTGLDIRYFFDPVTTTPEAFLEEEVTDISDYQ